MTTARRNLWIGIAVVAAAQALVLGWMVWERVHLLASGREIVLDVIPLDPRDLFRGDYVTLGYDISRFETPAGEKALRRGSVLYVTLQKGADDKWKVSSFAPAPPANPQPDQIVIKGRVEYASPGAGQSPGQMTVRYGIESYFVPEGTGQELEKLVGEKKLDALIAVDSGGNAAIKGLVADGKQVYEEPLF